MATLALSMAGQAAGAALGGPVGAVIGRALGALAGSVIDDRLFGSDSETAGGIAVPGSSEGAPIPRLYGWSRLSGNIIWATDLEDLGTIDGGSKASLFADEGYAASFALGLCEGEVHRLGRIWADGEVLDTSDLTIRFYRGTETQEPDSFIAGLQAHAPAYRGLSYVVFERLPLARFGNRLPVLSVEVCRVVGELEPLIEAVTVIPGATEFGYDPVARVRLLGQGETINENAHQQPALSDWTLSIDELQALCPNLKHVSLVVSWFGDDLRAANCTLAPRVEAASRNVKGASWQVGGLTRSTARVVSSHDGAPAYGGTPSDEAVKAAIRDLTRRGLKVTLYPLIMMDIPAGNAMGQPAYPWRGRISISAAASGTAAAATECASFARQYRAMMLHYAALAAAAGGVECFVMGSEMRGMTVARGIGTDFPFVTALVTLAAELKAVLGSRTTLTYGADWSEYSGVQNGTGEKLFHLDPLWASAAIGAVGIDCYMPLADWRDDMGPDDAKWDSTYDVGYLQANIEGGEGFDWYYASDADRTAGARTRIADGAHGEAWIWRYKDVRSFWTQKHFDRPGGVRSVNPTGWVPQSKPLYLIEAGCGAVDKGANQPNLFSDPKSSESGAPCFSTGVPDALMQRQALRAVLGYWAKTANNPTSPAGVRMIGRTYLWTWDARPYPAFPVLQKVWADGRNHLTGHWLTGRLGSMASDELLRAIAADSHVTLSHVDVAAPLVVGQVINRPGPARDAMAPLLAAAGLNVHDTPDGLVISTPALRRRVAPGEAVDVGKALRTRRHDDPADTIGRLSLSYIDRERSYQTGAITALAEGSGPVETQAAAMVLDLPDALRVAQRLLIERRDRGATLSLVLPPSQLQLDVGDVLDVDGHAHEIMEIRDGLARQVTARRLASRDVSITLAARSVPAATGTGGASEPVLLAAHLPPLADAPTTSRLVLGAYARPWPGRIVVTNEANGSTLATLTAPAGIGWLTSALGSGPAGRWDNHNQIAVKLKGAHLAATTESDVLAGANRLAVLMDSGEWEIIGFAKAMLTGSETYALSRLLRGQEGTETAIGSAAIGQPCLVLDDGLATLSVGPAWIEAGLTLRTYAGSSDTTGTTQAVTLTATPALPLSPAHLTASREANGDVILRWEPRSRADGNAWVNDGVVTDYLPERYRVTVLGGAKVLRSTDVSSNALAYGAAQQQTDFSALPAGFSFTVAQVSPLYGAGPAATGRFAAK